MEIVATSNTNLCESSLAGRRWAKREVAAHAVAAIQAAKEVPDVVARLLAARGVAPEALETMLHPQLKTSLPDPNHFKDMDKAAERVAAAVIGGETIGVFGDYDVDGATASAVLKRFLRALGVQALTYIPDRQKEGYGPNLAAFQTLQKQGASLIVTVDCGTLSFAPLKAAFDMGLDVIVVDHHQSEATLPACVALVNPNRVDESSPHTYFAAVGMAFMLCVAVNRLLKNDGFYTGRSAPDLMALLDVVALGTVCDMVPLVGANRALVAQGLKVMASRNNLGLAALMDTAKMDRLPEPFHLGFLMGPRINAGGRVGESTLGVRLLTTEDAEEARTLAEHLSVLNRERQAIEELMMEEALKQAEEQDKTRAFLLLSSDHWHSGVVGIIAGRMKERFHKPVAVVTFEGGDGKASSRSIHGFDLGAAVINLVQQGLLIKGGGHAMAAGFSVAREKLAAAHDALEAALASSPATAGVSTLEVDATIAARAVNLALAKEISGLGPFGIGNPEPLLLVENVLLDFVKPFGTSHMSLGLRDAVTATRMKAIAFRIGETPIGDAFKGGIGKKFNLLGTLSVNHYQGREEPQFKIVDAVVA